MSSKCKLSAGLVLNSFDDLHGWADGCGRTHPGSAMYARMSSTPHVGLTNISDLVCRSKLEFV